MPPDSIVLPQLAQVAMSSPSHYGPGRIRRDRLIDRRVMIVDLDLRSDSAGSSRS